MEAEAWQIPIGERALMRDLEHIDVNDTLMSLSLHSLSVSYDSDTRSACDLELASSD